MQTGCWFSSNNVEVINLLHVFVFTYLLALSKLIEILIVTIEKIIILAII